MTGSEFQKLQRALDQNLPLPAGIVHGHFFNRAKNSRSRVLDDDIDLPRLLERLVPGSLD